MIKFRKSDFVLLFALGLTFLFNHAAGNTFADAFYRNSVFQFIRIGYDYTLGWSPVPMVYICIFAAIIGFILYLRRRRTYPKIKLSFFMLLKSWIKSLTFLFILFYFFWGFNYNASSIRKSIGLKLIEVDTTMVFEEGVSMIQKLNLLREQISRESSALNHSFCPTNVEEIVRNDLSSVLSSWKIPTTGRPRIRMLYPKGILLRISTAGVYLPYVFEGHIDAGLSPLQWPFTMAHEMTHSYGITDEGECNFAAILACLRSENKFVKYSGMLAYWRYLANNLRLVAPHSFEKLVELRNSGIASDIKDIYEHLETYPDVLPQVRDIIYDSYLKSNGVVEGINSYDKVVTMMLSYNH